YKNTNPKPKNIISGNAHSGDYYLKFHKDNIYGGSFEFIIPDSLIGKKNIYLKFSSFYKEESPNSAKKALYTIDISNINGKTLFYKASNIKQVPDEITGQWRKSETGVKLPLITDQHHSIKLYIWNKEKSNFLIDDFNLDFYEYNQE
ncbi:MAG: hypothetical protein C0598_08880, partial [Marinilabiliales bacterium]